MPELTLRLFGNFEILTHDKVIVRLKPKSRALLAVLALEKGSRMPRLQIIEKLWPECPVTRARDRLNNQFWHLKKELMKALSLQRHSPDIERYVQSSDDAIALCSGEHISVDVHDFNQKLKVVSTGQRRSLKESEIKELQESVDLYRGDLLSDFGDDWCLILRESFRAKYQRTLETLLRHHFQEENWRRAIEYGERLVSDDPLLEHVHRDLMRCHAGMGDRALAAKQFRRCAEALDSELGIPPMEETIQLFQLISVSTQRFGAQTAVKPMKADSQSTQPAKKTRGSVRAAMKAVKFAEKRLHEISKYFDDLQDT